MIKGCWSTNTRNMLLPTLIALGAVSSASAGETITYFHNDILGSPVVATDINGLVAWKEHYRPYGDRIIDATESANNALWYTGKSHDEETGLTYMGARYYDPVSGRFMGIDPAPIDLRNTHSFNRYTYANNNPLKYTDPTGKYAQVAWCVGGPAGCAAALAAIGASVYFSTPTGQKQLASMSAGFSKYFSDSEESEDAGPEDAIDKPHGDDIKFDDKIRAQLEPRGWTEESVRELTETDPSGTSVDHTTGEPRPATVYGEPQGGHVIVNDETGQVVQVSDRFDPDWRPDRRIKWKENPR